MRVGGFFHNENLFQLWAMDELSSFGNHAQPLQGDVQYPGIPDLSIGMPTAEVWAEVKLWRTEFDVHTKMRDAQKKERELTAQQHNWLTERHRRGKSICGVLLAFRNGHNIKYVSFIPIEKWDEFLGYSLATLILSRYTDTLDSFIRGKNTIHNLILGSSDTHAAQLRDVKSISY